MELTREAREVLLRVTLEPSDHEEEPGTWEAVAAVRVDPGESDPALTLAAVARGEEIEEPCDSALEAILAGVRRVFPDQSFPLRLAVEVAIPDVGPALGRLLAQSLNLTLDKREWKVQVESQGS